MYYDYDILLCVYLQPREVCAYRDCDCLMREEDPYLLVTAQSRYTDSVDSPTSPSIFHTIDIFESHILGLDFYFLCAGH